MFRLGSPVRIVVPPEVSGVDIPLGTTMICLEWGVQPRFLYAAPDSSVMVASIPALPATMMLRSAARAEIPESIIESQGLSLGQSASVGPGRGVTIYAGDFIETTAAVRVDAIDGEIVTIPSGVTLRCDFIDDEGIEITSWTRDMGMVTGGLLLDDRKHLQLGQPVFDSPFTHLLKAEEISSPGSDVSQVDLVIGDARVSVTCIGMISHVDGEEEDIAEIEAHLELALRVTDTDIIEGEDLVNLFVGHALSASGLMAFHDWVDMVRGKWRSAAGAPYFIRDARAPEAFVLH